MKQKVLWIEDNALSDLQNVLGPVYVDGRYELAIAEDVSEAERQILREPFDAVIVDIRLPPGEDRRWVEYYKKSGNSRITARLGLTFLYAFLCPDAATVKLNQIPNWISATRFGVFTVESRGEVQKHLETLKVKVYQQKTAETSTRIILDMLAKITENANHRR